ncbi:MAG: hypothetical protein ACI9OJ_000507 [Myxococcota bacterium]|jgi:hypothetical protein
MTRGQVRMAVVLSVVFLVAACNEDENGRVDGRSLTVKNCTTGVDRVFEPYTLEGDYISLDLASGIAFIRMQTRGRPLGLSDVLLVHIQDVSAMQARIGMPTPFDDTLVRAGLDVPDSCPDTRQPMGAVGEITFSSLNVGLGERISATMTFDLMDLRTKEMVGFDFTASFDFEVQSGSDYLPFSVPGSTEP